jgi:hypothetical protein
MGMRGKAIVAMPFDAMVALARLLFRINVNYDERKIIDFVEKMVPHLFGNSMSCRERYLRGKRYVDLRVQTMTEPASANIRNFFDSRYMFCRVPDFIGYMRINAIKNSREDLLAALDDDAEYRNSNNQSDNRVGKRIAKPDPEYTDKHCEARPPVDPGMLAVGNERRAADPPPNANAKNCNGLIAYKPNPRCDRDGPKMPNVLGVEKSHDGLVTGDNCAEKYRENDRDSGKILDAPIAECKTLVRPPPRKQKCDAQRKRRRGVAKIMDGVCQQAHAA